MAYIGQQPVVGRYILLDQISGGFNGTTSGFTMSTAGGVQGVKPGLAQNVLLSLGGVIQQPGVDYTISGSGITFTTPPVSGTTFFATVLGDMQSVGTPSDGTVTPASIASGFDFGFPNVNVTGVTTIASGSVTSPSLSVTGDSNTGLFSPVANTIAISNDGTETIRVTSSGHVGISTSSPEYKLDISAPVFQIGETTDAFLQYKSSAGTWHLGANSSNAFALFTGEYGSGTEHMRVDSSGRLLVNTTSARSDFFGTSGLNAVINVEGTDNATRASSFVHNANDDTQHLFVLGKSRGTAAGGNTLLQSGDNLGGYSFHGADGSKLVEAARIGAQVDGTPSADDMPGRLIFYTTADGASTTQERMRINSLGHMSLGVTSDNTNARLFVYAAGTSSSDYAKIIRNSDGDNLEYTRADQHYFNDCIYTQTTTSAANVHIDGSARLLRTTSSIKYKTDVETLSDFYADAILNVRPVWYRSLSPTDNPDWGWYGFIAEELAEIDPRLVIWKTKETTIDEEGNPQETVLEEPVAEGVQYDRFAPHFLNLLQRQHAEIEELKASNAALLARVTALES